MCLSLQESYAYRDPITEFVECLYVKFDFDMAQQKLVECEKVHVHAYFLSCRSCSVSKLLKLISVAQGARAPLKLSASGASLVRHANVHVSILRAEYTRFVAPLIRIIHDDVSYSLNMILRWGSQATAHAGLWYMYPQKLWSCAPIKPTKFRRTCTLHN